MPRDQLAILLHLRDAEDRAGEGATVAVRALPAPKVLGIVPIKSLRDQAVCALIVMGEVELVGDREHVQLTHRGRVQADLQRRLRAAREAM